MIKWFCSYTSNIMSQVKVTMLMLNWPDVIRNISAIIFYYIFKKERNGNGEDECQVHIEESNGEESIEENLLPEAIDV